MDTFDSLNFFEAPKFKEKVIENSIISFQKEISTKSIIDEINNEEDTLLHILDFPILTKNLPRYVIITILKLLEPKEETNFYIKSSIKTKINIDLKSIKETEIWLIKNGYFKLSKNLINLIFIPEIFNYLNKILSSKYFKNDEEIIQLISLRIAENSGRTAKPNFQRKIKLKNFKKDIILNEPSLISDNLGLKTWGSSLILSEFIIKNKDKLLKEPILELGSGTGLVGITISLLGYKVILTDLPEILPNLIKNINYNHVNADCVVLDWTNPSSFLKQKGKTKYNTIIISDPIYSSDHPILIINMIKLFLNNNKDSKVLIQIPIRKCFEKDRKKLWSLLKNDFKIVNEKKSSGFDDFGAQKFIYKEIKWK